MAPEAPRARASPGRGPSHRVATNAMPSGFASYAERGLRSLDLLGNTSASGLSLLRCLFCRRQTTKTSLHLFGPLGRRKGAPSIEENIAVRTVECWRAPTNKRKQ